MELGLSGKRVAVMAASRGLGRAAAAAIAADGGRVAICARHEGPLAATAAEIGAVGIVADLSTPDGPRAFIDAAVKRLGGLDALVFNGGGPPPGHFDAMSDADWERAFQQLVMSYVRGVRAALPHLIASAPGAVVAIESMSVKQPIENLVLSTALRPSVIALSKTLALEHAKDNVRFNVVLPGSIATERIKELTEERARETGRTVAEAMAERVGAIPMARLGEPAEIGRAVAFLASPASSYVTGAVLQVDGGAVRSVY